MKIIKDDELYIIMNYLIYLTKDINRMYNKHHEGINETTLYNNQIKNISSLAKEILPIRYLEHYSNVSSSHIKFLLEDYQKNNEVKK